MNENASHGAPKKGLRMENYTKQTLRMAPNSKVEDLSSESWISRPADPAKETKDTTYAMKSHSFSLSTKGSD